MSETPEQLASRIRVGEDSRLELKAVAFAGDKVRGPAREDFADELAAMANTSGGVVVLGVEDKTREVVGIPIDQLGIAERFVAELCHDSIRPPLVALIENLLLPRPDGTSRAVIRVQVERGLFVHESPGGYFHRVGSSKRRMTPDHLARLMQLRSRAGMLGFDEQVVGDAALDDLETELVDRFRTPRTADDRETLLRKLAMARLDDVGTLRPTVAGLLLGCRAPERRLRHAYIQAVAYRGDDVADAVRERGYQLDARDIGGPLDQQVTEACRFVFRNMRIEATKTIGRHDVPQYDMTAVFEAIVNAVAHRDYSMHGSKIRLRMFANRLELFSPGALPNSMSVDSLSYRQASRNEVITSLLAKCPVPSDLAGLETSRTTLMDRRGEGVAIILQRSEKLAGRRPLYWFADPSELILTIWAASAQRSAPA